MARKRRYVCGVQFALQVCGPSDRNTNILVPDRKFFPAGFREDGHFCWFSIEGAAPGRTGGVHRNLAKGMCQMYAGLGA